MVALIIKELLQVHNEVPSNSVQHGLKKPLEPLNVLANHLLQVVQAPRVTSAIKNPHKKQLQGIARRERTGQVMSPRKEINRPGKICLIIAIDIRAVVPSC